MDVRKVREGKLSSSFQTTRQILRPKNARKGSENKRYCIGPASPEKRCDAGGSSMKKGGMNGRRPHRHERYGTVEGGSRSPGFGRHVGEH